jgi:hypothetical protein
MTDYDVDYWRAELMRARRRREQARVGLFSLVGLVLLFLEMVF